MRALSCAANMVQKTLSVLCAAGLLVSTTFAQTNPAAPLPSAPAAPQQAPPQTIAQQAQAAAQPEPVTYQGPFHIEMPHSHNPLAPYRPSTVPPVDLQNSQRLYGLIRDGKLYISLQDAIALALENNLTLASFRYNFPIAQADLQRTKAGGLANGVNIGVTQTTQSGFGASGGGGGSSSSECGRRRRRHRYLRSRRRRGRSLVRPLPQLRRLCEPHRHPGGERFPGRHPDPEDKQYRGPIAVPTVLSARHRVAGQLHRPARGQQQPL